MQADGGDPRRNPIEFPFEVKGVEANQRTTEVEVVGLAHRPALHDRVTEQLATLDGCDRAGARDYEAFLGFFSLDPS